MVKVQCQACMLYFPPSVTSGKNISNPFLFFPCGHGMCKKCTEKDTMFRDTCPFCRRPKGASIQLYMDFVMEDEEVDRKLEDLHAPDKLYGIEELEEENAILQVEGKKTRDALAQLKENHDKLKVKTERLIGQNGDYLNEIGRINQELGKKNQQIKNEKEARTRVEKQRDDALEQCKKERNSRERLEQKVDDLRAGMAKLSRKNEGLEWQTHLLQVDHKKEVATEKDAFKQLKESHDILKVRNKKLMGQNDNYSDEIQCKNQELVKKNQQVKNEREEKMQVEKERDDALEQWRKERSSRRHLEQEVDDLREGMARLSRKNERYETRLKTLQFDHTKELEEKAESFRKEREIKRRMEKERDEAVARFEKEHNASLRLKQNYAKLTAEYNKLEQQSKSRTKTVRFI